MCATYGIQKIRCQRKGELIRVNFWMPLNGFEIAEGLVFKCLNQTVAGYRRRFKSLSE